MLYSDLTLIVVVMVNALILNESLAANETVQMDKTLSVPSKVILPYWTEANQNFIRHNKKGKNFKKEFRQKLYLDPLIIKLDNVIDKYQLKKNYLEDLYTGVVRCGLSRCEKFKNLIPENQRIRRLNCLKKQNGLKRMTSDLLRSFHKGVQRIDKSFQAIINLEKWPHLHDISRQKILEEFKTDIKTLNVEIETAMLSKRLNFIQKVDGTTSERLPHFNLPENQTNLMIYEWRIIQASKRFLRDWRKNLNKVYRCLKKKKRENNKKRKKNNSDFMSKIETLNKV